MTKNHPYQDELIRCYSEQAEHFHNTRKKFRPEVAIMKSEIDQYRNNIANNNAISLVDIGCGSGRLSELLINEGDNISYLGVDNAPGMIDVASKAYPEHNFVCKNMEDYTQSIEQESKDIIIALASIQHLQGVEKQQEVLLGMYRGLKRGGKVMLVNRSFSDWFLKKYWRDAVSAIGKSFVKKEWSWNDIMITWKDKSYHQNNTSYERMYHIYTLHELETLCTMAGFVIEKSGYVHQDGSFGKNWRKSRNSILILKKSV